jgi:hypothetical protein
MTAATVTDAGRAQSRWGDLSQEVLTRLGELPELVQRYLEQNVSPGALNSALVCLEQVGEMQLKPGRWSPFQAEQSVAADRVEFTWRATFRLMPFVSLRVRDWYRAGSAGLDGRLWGWLRIFQAGSPAVARGEAIRYLAELPLAPQAMVLNAELAWRTVDESTVDVRTLVGAETVVVAFQFNVSGDIVAASSPARPRAVGKQVVETPFRGTYSDHLGFPGVRVPTKAEAVWLLPDGAFTYFRCRITAWSNTQPAGAP